MRHEEANEGSGRGAMKHSAIKAARTCARALRLRAVNRAHRRLRPFLDHLRPRHPAFSAAPRTQTPAQPAVSEEQLLSAAKQDFGSGGAPVGEIAHGCPRLSVSPHGNHLTIYEDGRAGDGLAIMHRGEITKTARECQIEPGRVTVRYGFSGRVLLGPRGHAGSVRLPINVTVTDAKRAKVTSDTVSVDATVAVDNPIGYFSTVRTVTFDIPEGTRPGEFEVFVGFDQKAQGAG